MTLHGINRIKYCQAAFNEFYDYIYINSSEDTLSKKYAIYKTIQGHAITNRIENLVVACWSAKDWMSKDIASRKGDAAAKQFVDAIHSNDSANLIAYLANKTKHGGVDRGTNPYRSIDPQFGNVILTLVNTSFPGNLKPIFQIEGSVVPPFEIYGVAAVRDDEVYSDFDKITLDVKVLDKLGNFVCGINAKIDEYCTSIDGEFRKYV